MSDCPGHKSIDCSSCREMQALRDQFAMAALAGLIARSELAYNTAVGLRKGKAPEVVENIHTAYAYADAMLREREK